MLEIVPVPGSEPLADVVRDLLDVLPEWFGIAEANEAYVDSARHMAGYVARDGDDILGVLLLHRHFPSAAEVHLIAVVPDLHRRGVGSAMLAAAEADIRADGVRLLQVKTLGASHPDEGYAKTRAFYLATGFLQLEETNDLWDENPCLILVKPLS